MANKRNGQLTVTVEWAKHLQKLLKRRFWKRERKAGQEHTKSAYRSKQPLTLHWQYGGHGHNIIKAH